ncbi:hypothetical protein NL108_017756 [Boleophthalmus pectinirostris]|nr:hypothetical protein NL108_017756 [Boleophthalmus pectinirostris]
MVKTVAAAENAINKLQNNTVSIENSVMEVRAVVDAQFERLSATLEKTKRSLMELLEAEEKQAVKQADGIRVHLENRLSDLRKTQAQVQKISRNKSHLDFLQEYVEWKQEGADTSLPGVYIGLMDSLNSVGKIITESTDKLCSAIETEFTDRVKDACSNDESGLGIKTTVRTMIAAKHSQSLPDPQTRGDLLQYGKSFTFDLNTAHKFLRLTDENRKVTNTTPWQHPYADHDERFDHWKQVLAAESIYLDRTYCELDFSGDGTYLGLAYKSIERKGTDSNSCITSASAAWCVQWTGKSFSAWHGDEEVPVAVAPGQRFSRVGVYVDHAGGALRFYGLQAGEGEGDAEVTLIHEFRAEFREPLYPAFWLSKKENSVTMVTPGEPLKSSPSPPPSTLSPSNSSANLNANNNNNNNNGNNANTPPPSSPTAVSTVESGANGKTSSSPSSPTQTTTTETKSETKN